jgi:hypothetical protein
MWSPEFKPQCCKKKKIVPWARYCWFTTVILATWEAEIQRLVVRGQPRQRVWETPISKVTRTKWTGGMAQVVKCLLCKCETRMKPWVETPVTPKKKKKKQFPGLRPLLLSMSRNPYLLTTCFLFFISRPGSMTFVWEPLPHVGTISNQAAVW